MCTACVEAALDLGWPPCPLTDSFPYTFPLSRAIASAHAHMDATSQEMFVVLTFPKALTWEALQTQTLLTSESNGSDHPAFSALAVNHSVSREHPSQTPQKHRTVASFYSNFSPARNKSDDIHSYGAILHTGATEWILNRHPGHQFRVDWDIFHSILHN